MCALPQNQHLEFNSVTILWLETTELAYWALPINWWKHPAFTQTDLCVEYLLYLHFTSYDPQANKYRYWRNDGRIKGTLSTNGGFSFIYICQYIYIYPYLSQQTQSFPGPPPQLPRGHPLRQCRTPRCRFEPWWSWWLHPPYLEISGDIPPVLVAWNMDTRIPSGKLT